MLRFWTSIQVSEKKHKINLWQAFAVWQKSRHPSTASGPCSDTTDATAHPASCKSWHSQMRSSQGEHRVTHTTIHKTVGRGTPWLTLLGRSLQTTMERTQHGWRGQQLDHFFRVWLSQAIAASLEMDRLSEEIFIRFRMDFSARDNVLSVIVILMRMQSNRFGSWTGVIRGLQQGACLD